MQETNAPTTSIYVAKLSIETSVKEIGKRPLHQLPLLLQLLDFPNHPPEDFTPITAVFEFSTRNKQKKIIM